MRDAHKINKQNFIIGRGFTLGKNGMGNSDWSAILVIPIVE